MRVFVGPAPGWTGPAQTVHATAAATPALPADAKAYSTDKPAGLAAVQEGDAETSAPTALQNVVRTPVKAKSRKSARHVGRGSQISQG